MLVAYKFANQNRSNKEQSWADLDSKKTMRVVLLQPKCKSSSFYKGMLLLLLLGINGIVLLLVASFVRSRRHASTPFVLLIYPRLISRLLFLFDFPALPLPFH